MALRWFVYLIENAFQTQEPFERAIEFAKFFSSTVSQRFRFRDVPGVVAYGSR